MAPIPISESTFEKIKQNFVCRKLDLIRVKGKNPPIAIYELLERAGKLPADKENILHSFQQGLQSYENRQWAQTRDIFITL